MLSCRQTEATRELSGRMLHEQKCTYQKDHSGGNLEDAVQKGEEVWEKQQQIRERLEVVRLGRELWKEDNKCYERYFRMLN